MYSPRKKDAEAANSHEKEQLQSEDTTTKTPVHETQNGNGKHAIENGGSKVWCDSLHEKHYQPIMSSLLCQHIRSYFRLFVYKVVCF